MMKNKTIIKDELAKSFEETYFAIKIICVILRAFYLDMRIEIFDIKDLIIDVANPNGVLANLNIPFGLLDSSRLVQFLETLRDDLIVSVETDYVDAMYRDEYYHFYATKLHTYERNCIKLSFFEPNNLKSGNVVDYGKSTEIVNDYLGFLVVRPLSALVGRNVISPKAKKQNLGDIEICKSKVQTTALGLKVMAEGFPHSSQDGEMMACAETTLWSITEYFGNKYAGYRPFLPSELLGALMPTSYQRQIPSKGLTFNQISYGLRGTGFSPKIYNLRKSDPDDDTKEIIDEDMKEVFSCYIESGFPLALCLQSNSIGHAVVCVGRSRKDRHNVESEVIDRKSYYNWNRSLKEFVFNDDNFPCYQKSAIDNPTKYYNQPDWNDVVISSFIVPLPNKAYLDAYLAIKITKKIMSQMFPEGTCMKTYMASSRSYRNHIATSKLLSNENKMVLLSVELPKFIWVTEYSNKANFENGLVDDVMILDATESSINDVASIIVLTNYLTCYAYDSATKKLAISNIMQPILFETYNKNTL